LIYTNGRTIAGTMNHYLTINQISIMATNYIKRAGFIRQMEISNRSMQIADQHIESVRSSLLSETDAQQRAFYERRLDDYCAQKLIAYNNLKEAIRELNKEVTVTRNMVEIAEKFSK
jgi:hypothetical protein